MDITIYSAFLPHDDADTFFHDPAGNTARINEVT